MSEAWLRLRWFAGLCELRFQVSLSLSYSALLVYTSADLSCRPSIFHDLAKRQHGGVDDRKPLDNRHTGTRRLIR